MRSSSTDEARIKEFFGEVEMISGVADGECGFVTEEMSEAEYKDKAAKYGDILSMIRVD